MRRGRANRVAAAVVVAALAAGVPHVSASAAPSTITAPAAPRASGCAESPFSAGFDADLRARYPGKRITAAVYDTRTGCQYRYRSDLRITTASVLKIEIMAAVLLRAQRAGRTITASERALIGPMIRTSDDPSANALWRSVGATAGLAALERELGLDETRAASPWGLTSTSAADRNELLRQLVLGQWGPFGASARATARSFLLDITPSQRWGITEGVPSGWSVAMKNGFFPASCCGWRINTSGVVERPGGGAYVATVLSDGWPTEAAGIEAVERVSKVIASWNLADIGPHRSAARFARESARDVLGAAPSFAAEQASAWRVGADPSRADEELARLLGDPQVDRTSFQVLRLYLGILHRLPEASTWSGRTAQLRAGTRTIGQLADAVAWSSELAGGSTPLTTAQFVERAHERIFGRTPRAADRDWWVRRIDGGASRGSLLLELIGTATYRWASWQDVKVSGATLALLRRNPTGEERSTWVARMWAGRPTAELTEWLFRSHAYAARYR
ncbi:MAG: serine hydrolase [Acidimicrobiales bacterium]|nr:serine hydrolase [Acidimicrobiales bacterium]